jgi:hypothetical protein
MSPREGLDRLVGVCLKLLASAIALYLAVCLIESILVPLLIGVGVVMVAGLGIALLRWRNRGW